jgi:CHAD domain-containing protein
MLSSPAISYVTSSSPLWVAGRALLARRGLELFACWSKAARTLNQNAIHDLRVTSRRVQECVLLFGSCYRSDDIARLSRKLNRLTRRLGAIRGTDEALLFMEEIAKEVSPRVGESLPVLMDSLMQLRDVQARKVSKFLRKTRRYSLADLFQELNSTPDLFSPTGFDLFVPVRRHVRATMLPTLAEIESLAVTGQCEATSVALHTWRIALKKLRYRLEVVTPVMRKGPPDHVTAILQRYQDLLGRLHDLDLYVELVRNLVKDTEAYDELAGIILSKRARVWFQLGALVEEQPWAHLAARIEECL